MIITVETRIIRAENLPQANLGGETIAVLGGDAKYYFGFHDVAARIWEMLTVPRTPNEICTDLVAEYAISSEECEEQTLNFLRQLAHEGLVQIAFEVRSAPST